MKKKSLVMMLASLSLVGTIMVGATLAYFTDYTEAVTNTFTVGANVDIDLFENVKQDAGKEGYVVIPTTVPATNPERVPAGSGAEFVKMYPGLTLNKAPFVELATGSSDCYIRVTVAGVDELFDDGFTVAFNKGTAANQWTKVDGSEDLNGIYQYNSKVEGTTSEVATTPVFTSITFNAENKTSIPAADLSSIVVKAYAVQADGFDNAAQAFGYNKTGDLSPVAVSTDTVPTVQ